jgi:hypothetical protein
VTGEGTFHAAMSGTELKWSVVLTGLSGRATRITLQAGSLDKDATVLSVLCKRCRKTAEGTATLTPAESAAVAAGTTYVNVLTRKHKTGEIGGQVTKAG